MKLHKLNQLLGICVLCSVLTSCNDWLDVQPNTDVDREKIFENESGYADATSGIYASMSNNKLYGSNLSWYLLELMGGGAYSFGGINMNYQKFCFHPNTPYTYFQTWRNSSTDLIWSGEYNVIANINSMLQTIDADKDKFAGSDYNVFKGEALGLRAFLHFDILRLFSDAYAGSAYSPTKTYMPYVTDLSSDVYPLLTADSVCEKMLRDLKEASELLKSDPMYTGEEPSKYVCSTVSGNATYRSEYNIYDWHNRRFHFNYYAAIATMARIYLWKGDRENALKCAKEVIDAQPQKFPWVNPALIANTASTSKNNISKDRTFCTEQIFALNVTNLADKIDGYLWEGSVSFATSTVLMGMNTDYLFDALTRDSDPRYVYLRAAYLSDYSISTKLWQDDDANEQYFPWAKYRIPLIRVSEMYYIAAECEPDLAKATEYLEQVRRHRGLTPFPLDCSTKEELQAEIGKEYRKEFVSEGQLFYYKKRMNEDIVNVSRSESFTITPAIYTMPRPDDEDTYGNRN